MKPLTNGASKSNALNCKFIVVLNKNDSSLKIIIVFRKDVSLPTSMQRSMATEAEAARDARAKVVAAEGEQRASVALSAAADIIASNPIALQLRYLQTLSGIAAEKNSTIIFPIPIELLRSFAEKSRE